MEEHEHVRSSECPLWSATSELPLRVSLRKAHHEHMVSACAPMRVETHLSHGLHRTHDNRAPYAVGVTGGGRSSATSRRMSVNRFLGTATSAIWKAT